MCTYTVKRQHFLKIKNFPKVCDFTERPKLGVSGVKDTAKN